MGRSATRGPSGKRRSARKRREARYPSWTGSAAIAPPRFGEDTGRSPNRRLRRASASRGDLARCGWRRGALSNRGRRPQGDAPRRSPAFEGSSRHDESRSLARGDFARARRPVSAMLRRGSAVRLSAQTSGVDSRPRPLQLQRRSLAWAAMGVAYSDAEVRLLRLPPASGRRLAAGRRMRVKADLPRVR